MVFTYLLIKPLDLWYKGDEGMCLMYWLAINFVKFSEEKGVLLLVKKYFGGPYCKMSCWNLSCTHLVVLEEVSDETVFAECVTYQEVFLALVCIKSAVRYCHLPSGIAQISIGCIA